MVDQSLADAAMRPKLQVYKDCADIVSRVIRFERIALLLKLDPASLLLEYEVCSVVRNYKSFAALSPEIPNDYASLKAGLFSVFKKPIKSYRKSLDQLGWVPMTHITKLLFSWADVLIIGLILVEFPEISMIY